MPSPLGTVAVGGGLITVRIKGLEEVKRKLQQLSLIGQKKVADDAVKEGAKVIKEAIKEKAPTARPSYRSRKKTGSLKRSITFQKGRSPKNVILYKIGPDKKIAYYAHMVEFGTSLHTIKAKKHKYLKFGRTTFMPEFLSEQTYTEAFQTAPAGKFRGFVFIPKVKVKASAHPFVRPGFSASRFQAVEAISRRLLPVIQKVARGEPGWDFGGYGITTPEIKTEF